MSFYLRSLVLQPNQEASMKGNHVQVQADLFSHDPVPAGLMIPPPNREQLIDLIGRLLWEVVQGPTVAESKETNHEQDQC